VPERLVDSVGFAEYVCREAVGDCDRELERCCDPEGDEDLDWDRASADVESEVDAESPSV
jgi:hypothetical protein